MTSEPRSEYDDRTAAEIADDEMAEAFFAGKLPAFDVELEAVREEGRRVVFYAMLRAALLAINHQFRKKKVRDSKGKIIQRSPGWIAHLYREHYGEWPKREWDEFPLIPPNDEVLAAIKAKDSQWRRSFKLKKEEEENGGQVGGSEASDAVQQGAEGAGGVLDGGRVSGLEEQDDGTGELRETDERHDAD